MYIFPFLLYINLPFGLFLLYDSVYNFNCVLFCYQFIIVSTGDKISGYSLLRPFLSKQVCQPVKVLSDKNCLFRAISVALTGNQAYHLQLRQVIAAFEANEQLVLNGLHETINTSKFVDHIKSISQNGVWGTNVEMIAATTLFKMDVYVATDSYKPGVSVWLKYTPYLKRLYQILLLLQLLCCLGELENG